MTLAPWILILLTVFELLLLGLVFLFFWRLKRSEALLSQLQQKQESLLGSLRFNEELERELVGTFTQRQAELGELNEQLEARARELTRLIQRAEKLSRSPQFLRQTILSAHRQGQSVQAMAEATGLSPDEVELILSESGA
jgi:uncharacterized protein HemX